MAPMDDVSRKTLSRRTVLRGTLGVAVSAVIAACTRTARPRAGATPTSTPGTSTPTSTGTAMPSCVVRPSLTEGPYFVDEKLNRSDIRSDPSDGSVSEGVPLRIVMNVSSVDGSSCTALAGALVDIWHCDANGVYSDVASEGSAGKKFLRGYQATDANGRAEFKTIYPGWYRGRAVHIHFKIRAPAGSSRSYEFTSQLFFDDALSDRVYGGAPYRSEGERDKRNNSDSIYRSGGDKLLLALAPEGSGYAGTFDIGLQAG